MADTQVKDETELTALDGDEEFYARAPGRTPPDRRILSRTVRSGLMPAFPLPANVGIGDGVFHGPFTTGSENSAREANTLFMCPIPVLARKTYTKMAVVNHTVAAATAARLGLYKMDPLTFAPKQLIVDAGVVDLTTTGPKIITGLNLDLQPGWYLGAFVANGPSQCLRQTGSLSNVWTLSGTGIASWNGVGRSFTYGALPADDTANAGSYVNDWCPLVFLGA